jgi:hypothetical protein
MMNNQRQPVNNGVKWILAIVIIFASWYIISKQDESAANWLVVLILLSAYTYNRNSVNAELRRIGVLR